MTHNAPYPVLRTDGPVAIFGGAWGHSTWCTDATIMQRATAPVDVNTENPAGVVGGAQAGARWQAPGNFALGVEAMFDGMHIRSAL